EQPLVGDADPATHPCATIPDLVAWIGPRYGSALIRLIANLTTWPRGCPRVEPTPNSDRSWERDRDALKSRRGERMIFEGAGQRACSRPAQAKGWPAWTLISCLVQPRGCNPVNGKKRCRPKGTGQQVPKVTTREKKKIFYGHGPSIDFRGHLAVRFCTCGHMSHLNRRCHPNLIGRLGFPRSAWGGAVAVHFSAPNLCACFAISCRKAVGSAAAASIARRAYSFALALSPLTR